jgi:putative acetyltransferase
MPLPNGVSIRPETPEDLSGVQKVLLEAFAPSMDEEKIVNTLRSSLPAAEYVSFVAISKDEGDTVVGHVLFTPMVFETTGTTDKDALNTGLAVFGLAPLCVAPKWQKSGIGSALVEAGLAELRSRQTTTAAVAVLGHPEYYPRFGFESASKYGLACEFDGVPEGAFMVLELEDGFLSKILRVPADGVGLRYHTAFGGAGEGDAEG